MLDVSVKVEVAFRLSDAGAPEEMIVTVDDDDTSVQLVADKLAEQMAAERR